MIAENKQQELLPHQLKNSKAMLFHVPSLLRYNKIFR
jgi:hypothetical protein